MLKHGLVDLIISGNSASLSPSLKLEDNFQHLPWKGHLEGPSLRTHFFGSLQTPHHSQSQNSNQPSHHFCYLQILNYLRIPLFIVHHNSEFLINIIFTLARRFYSVRNSPHTLHKLVAHTPEKVIQISSTWSSPAVQRSSGCTARKSSGSRQLPSAAVGRA